MSIAVDFTDSAKVEARLKAATNRMQSLVGDVALARQVKEFASERRRMLLAKYSAPLLDSGRSQPQSEALSRASAEYKTELAMLEKEYQHAERTLAEWEAQKAIYEAARSLLSFSKETLRL